MSILGDKRLVAKKVQIYYIKYIDTTTDHITPCCTCMRGVIISNYLPNQKEKKKKNGGKTEGEKKKKKKEEEENHDMPHEKVWVMVTIIITHTF